MAARVIAMTGPAGSGKTTRMLACYREALAKQVPHSTLWLAPSWRAAAATRDRLLDGSLTGCLSPAVMTFDDFAEAILHGSPVAIRPLSRLRKRQLIRMLLDEQIHAGRIRHFLPIARTGGLVDLICELISELKRLDVWPDRLRRACEARGITEKDVELLAVYEAYQDLLNERQLYDAEGRFWSARQLLREGRRGPFDRLRLVAVDGFADFTPPQHEILQILAGWVEQLYVTLPLEPEPRREELFSKPLATLSELRRLHPGLVEERLERPGEVAWPAMAHLEANLFGNPRQARPAPDTGGLEILAASRQLGEIELIGSRIKRLLTTGSEQTGGRPVPPGDIAVVFRSLGDADALVREVFGRLGIPVALEAGQMLAKSPALTALVGLVRLDVEDWPFRQLLAVLANNYFRPDWPEWDDGAAAAAAERAIRSLQIPRGRRQLLDQLRRQSNRRISSREHDGRRVSGSEQGDRARLAFSLLEHLSRLFDQLPGRATLGGWAAAWQKLAEQTGLLRAIEEDQPPAPQADRPGRPSTARTTPGDLDAWKALQEALAGSDKLAGLLGRTPPRLDRPEALTALLDTLGSVTISDRLDECGRVRVLSAPSARAIRGPYLFFAGLAERSFPPPDRQDRLYSEAEYRRLIDQGLPLAASAERNREEMLLFYEVMTRASRRLFLSYPALDEAAQPLSASPYLEEVEGACGAGRIHRTDAADLSPIPADEDPLTAAEFRVKAVASALEGDVSLLAGLIGREPEPGLADNLLWGLQIVEARQDRSAFGPAEGLLAGGAVRQEMATRFGPARTFSATELEQYASCPFQFFVDRVLGLEAVEGLDLAVDYLARGRLVHDALADLHRRVNQLYGGPASPADLDEQQYERLLGETLQAIAAHPAGSPLEAALREVDRRLLIQWAADYRRQHRSYDEQWQDCQAPLLPTWFEAAFGRSGRASPLASEQPLEIPAGGELIRIAGRIDRIDTGTVAGRTVFNVLDYKTGTSARFSPEAAAAGTALQLPLYVMAAEQLLLADQQAVPWQAGYWYLRDGGFKPRQALKMHECRGQDLQPTPQWGEVRRTVVETVAALVRAIRGGQFPVYSADEQCTRFCPFYTICRINQVRSLEKTWQPLGDPG